MIPRLLDQVFKDHNSMVWDFLEAMGKVEARAYFEKLEDVRPFVAATMARDCAEAHTFPVDNDISRTLGRVGVVQPGKETEAELQAFLERAVKSTRALEVHQLLKRLAQEFCGAEDRLCIRCVLRKMCPSVDLTRRPSKTAKAAKAAKGKVVKVRGSGRTQSKPGRRGAAGKAAARPRLRKPPNAGRPSATAQPAAAGLLTRRVMPRSRARDRALRRGGSGDPPRNQG